MPDAEVGDVQDRYEGTLNELRTQLAIDDASVVLRALIPGLDARIIAGTTTAAAVKIVVVRMVLRVLRNPAGYKNEQAGDYGYSVDTEVASGRLFLTADDRALLGLGAGGKVGTILVGSSYRASTGTLDAES